MESTHDVQPDRRYEVTASSVKDGRASARALSTSSAIDVSSSGVSELPGPAELLAVAFAACVLKNIERFSAMLPFEYERAGIHVVSVRIAPPPQIARIEYRIEVVTTEPDSRLQMLHRNIAKFGTIYNTLAASCDVSGTIVAVRPSARADEEPVSSFTDVGST